MASSRANFGLDDENMAFGIYGFSFVGDDSSVIFVVPKERK